MTELLSKKYPKCKHQDKTPLTSGGSICAGWSRCENCGDVVRSDLTFDQFFTRFMMGVAVVLIIGVASLNYIL